MNDDFGLASWLAIRDHSNGVWHMVDHVFYVI